MQTHSSLQVVACAPHLPAGAQQHLAALDGRQPHIGRAQAVLAAREDLDDDAAATLSQHPDPLVRRRTLASSRNQKLLIPRSSSQKEAVAANRNTDPDLLAQLAEDEQPATVLRAVCNPATPEKARRKALADPEAARQMVARSSPLGAQVVRAGELAACNRWLLEDFERQSEPIARGLTGLPECPPELLEGRGRWPAARWHPAAAGKDIDGMSDRQLAESPSAAAHLALLGRESMRAEHAARILKGYQTFNAQGRRRDVDAEPHILAALGRRFGSSMLTAGERAPTLAGTRISTSGWAHAYSGELLQMFCSWGADRRRSPAETLQDAQDAVSTLNEDRAAWKIFARLVTGSHWDAELMTDAAEIARI